MPLQRETLFFFFKEKYPQLCNFLCQAILLIITFESAIAIARYGPERDNPTSVLTPSLYRRASLSDANSTTPHICKYGAREDYMDLGPLTPLTPYPVLCPSTPFLLLSILTYTTGMIKFNLMQPEKSWHAYGLYVGLYMSVGSIDWRHILVSLQMYGPMNIWFGSVFIAVIVQCGHKFSPQTDETLRENKRREEEEKRMEAAMRLREAGGVIEGGIGVEEEHEVQEEPGEETPLRG